MAHSFFYGYLQLVLSKSCSGQKNFKENVEVYESNNSVKFATKKLYILIPLSAHCPNELHEASDKIENGGVRNPIEIWYFSVYTVYKNIE